MTLQKKPSAQEIREENRKIRQMKLLVDFTCALLAQADLTLKEMLNLTATAKKRVLELFPGKEATFDLIYKPRFERIIRERTILN